MKFYVYLIENKDGNETMAGYFVNSIPVPMVCDERQVDKLNDFAEQMCKEHSMTVKRVLIETNDQSNEEPVFWKPEPEHELSPEG